MNPHTVHFTDYLIYLYEDGLAGPNAFNDHTLTTAGRVGVRHDSDQWPTPDMVRDSIIKERNLPAGDYRVMPATGRFGVVFDITVESTVSIVGLSATKTPKRESDA